MERKPKVLCIGQSVLVRSVTHYYTGRIVSLEGDAITLADAAWIASTGRFSAALATGELDEVEPYPGPVTIMRGAIVDVTRWPHPLPRTMK